MSASAQKRTPSRGRGIDTGAVEPRSIEGVLKFGLHLSPPASPAMKINATPMVENID
jgi:hypothetical protein